MSSVFMRPEFIRLCCGAFSALLPGLLLDGLARIEFESEFASSGTFSFFARTFALHLFKMSATSDRENWIVSGVTAAVSGVRRD
jgi:hypothetical protein